MVNIKKTAIRAIRKSAHLSGKILSRGHIVTSKIEDKTTRIITGKDFSVQLTNSIPVEKALFNGIHYNIAPLNPALPIVGRSSKITLLLPSLNNRSFFGGTATAIIIAGKLAEKLGKPLRIIETLSPGGKNGLGDFLNDNDIHLINEVELIDVSARTYNRYGYIDLHPDDILMASAWWDAKLLSQLPTKHKFIYLIQDFEPIFYSNSDEYVFAESTYKTNDFIPLCNTKLMYEFMCNNGYSYIEKEGMWFEPAVSKKYYGKSIENKRKKRIFLYGRPSVARNLFYSALDALNKVFNSGELSPDDWEIYMAGQDKLPNITLSTGIVIKNLGKLPIDDYNNFIKTVDIALSPMMAPHPNYPTLEFASVGAVVVTTRYKNKQDLSSYSKNIIMSECSIADIAKAIVKASKLSYKQRLNNLGSASISESWNDSLSVPLENIIRLLSL